MNERTTLKVLAVIEAATVIGPAKNLIEFCRRVRTLTMGAEGLPAIDVSIATFHRGAHDPAATGIRQANGQQSAAAGAPNEFVAAARAAGIEVDVIYERFRFDTRVRGELRRIIERRAPDIIQTHQVKSHFLLLLSRLWQQYPWIAFHHGYTATDLKTRCYNSLNRLSLPIADRVVTVCHAFAEQLESAGVARDRIRVRHNSIDMNRFSGGADLDSALRHRYAVADGERVVLAVGRFSREKAHVDLVRALGSLQRRDPDMAFKLVLVGSGPEGPQIERAAEQEGIRERVIFAGQVTDVRPYYALADVMVLPSHSEGSPNVLLEAMAAGVPTVATRVGGVPEIATHDESALLVAPRAPEEITAALCRLWSDPKLSQQLVTSAAALIAARYTPQAYAREMAGIYCELAARGQVRGPAVTRRT